MNASIPKALMQRQEFWCVGELARLVLRIVWRRGEEQRWAPMAGATTGRGALLLDLQKRAMFLGELGPLRLDEVVVECLAAGLLIEDDGVLALSVPSSGRRAPVQSGAAARKARQRALDAAVPERVVERQRKRAGGVTSSVTSAVTSNETTRDGHAVADAFARVSSDERQNNEEDISSSSSSPSGVTPTREGARATDVTVSHAVTSRADVTPNAAALETGRGASRILLEESKGAISGTSSRTWRKAFDAEVAVELPDLTAVDLSLVAAFCSEKRRLIAAFAAYRSAIADDVQRQGTVSLQVLRGARAVETRRPTFAPLSDLVRRARAWQAMEQARARAALAASTNAPSAAPGLVRAATPGDMRKGLNFGGAARPAGGA